MSPRWKTILSAVVAIAAVALIAYSRLDPGPGTAPPARAQPPVREVPVIQDAVLYDGEWEITEGVWALTDQTYPKLWDDATASNGLLIEAGRRSLWIMAPGLYGGFPVRVTSHVDEPPAPAWCEDVVEAPLHSDRGRIAFVGFDNSGERWDVGVGDLRVRLCAEGLDDRLADPERPAAHGTSASRFELQVWPAVWAPGEVVQVGSDYAREAHSRVGS